MTSNSADVLLPCPFCAAQGKAERTFPKDNDGLEWTIEIEHDIACPMLNWDGYVYETEAIAVGTWNYRPEAAAEIERLRATLQQIAHLEVPRPVEVQYMPDRPSKHDKCAHDVWMYQECGNCISDFATAALSQESAG